MYYAVFEAESSVSVSVSRISAFDVLYRRLLRTENEEKEAARVLLSDR
jgi:hypothetical protein